MKNDGVIREEKESREAALHYMKTLVDVTRESFLILDPKLKVIEANPTFYQNFKVLQEETVGILVYELGNGQWNISELKKLLEEILPEKKEVRDYEVTHNFETIGEKTIVLNAKQIDSLQLIILVMEDITSRKTLEEQLVKYTVELEAKVKNRTKEIADKLDQVELLNKTMVGRELKMIELKKEIKRLKKLIANRNNKV